MLDLAAVGKRYPAEQESGAFVHGVFLIRHPGERMAMGLVAEGLPLRGPRAPCGGQPFIAVRGTAAAVIRCWYAPLA